MTTSYLVPMYLTYLVIAVGLCFWLAKTLYRNGAVFLEDLFPDRPEFAGAVNHLLVTGFAMLNLGYGLFLVQGGTADDPAEAIQLLARKLGILLVSLAVAHFCNLVVLHRIADRRRQSELRPPVAPQRWVNGHTPDEGHARPAPGPPPPAPVAAPAPATWSPNPA